MAGHNRIRYNGHPAWERLDPDVWPEEELNGPRARAKQLEMLHLDMQHALDWVEQMNTLVDQQLPDEEFVMQRMTALKLWEKGRARAQKALNFRYDPLRRRKDLIDRDIDKALANAREKLTEVRIKLEARQVAVNATVGPIEAPAPAARAVREGRPVAPPALHPGLAKLDENVRDTYEHLAPDIDITTTPDDELRRIWAERNEGMSAEAIEWVIEQINAP